MPKIFDIRKCKKFALYVFESFCPLIPTFNLDLTYQVLGFGTVFSDIIPDKFPYSLIEPK